MTKLGLLNIDSALDTVYDVDLKPIESPEAPYVLNPLKAKDATVGHWRWQASFLQFPTYPDGFFGGSSRKLPGEDRPRKVLCNKPYSRTDVVGTLVKKLQRLVLWCLYLSQILFQIAAQQERGKSPRSSIEYCSELRDAPELAFDCCSRCARPFEGEWPYQRTSPSWLLP